MSEISGDFAKLGKLIAIVGDTSEHKLELAKDMVSWIDKRIASEFWTHRSPYGDIWPERSPRSRRTNALMVDTATLMTGFVESISEYGIDIQNPTEYARPLEYGTSRMPPRTMLPFDEDLGEWADPLITIAARTLEKRLAL